jgi:pimeloyl-ACP methyl ester carboxylesterase
VVRANPASADLTGITGAASATAAVVQPFRTGAALTAYYHVPRSVPFVYMAPTGTAPAGGWPLVIFQHGITSQKESVFTIAQTLAAVGYAVVAIDMPLHGALQVTGHTTGSSWGQDFMAIGAPLTGRSNFQQGAFNLNRLEFTVRTGGFAGLGTAQPSVATIRYIGHSLGAMVGAYYLAGNTTLNTTAGAAPYTQTSLNADMKGYLGVPGGRTAYVIQNSPAFGPTVDAGLAAVGVAKGSPSYHQFFLVTQTVIDPCDPATMTTPLAAGLPSRLSNRIVIQESTSTAFSTTTGLDGNLVPTNGDLVITNPYTRYFGNALGGRAVLGLGASAANAAAAAAVAPGFAQLAYSDTTHTVAVPSQFMLTLSAAGAPTPKVATAAASGAATTPTEGDFQFDQTGIGHSSLLDLSNLTNSLGLTQKQMRYFISLGIVVDPYFAAPALPIKVQATPDSMDVKVAPYWDILSY